MEVYNLYLDCDIYESSTTSGCLPANIRSMHRQILCPGKLLILQIDEIVNVGVNFEHRDDDATGGGSR